MNGHPDPCPGPTAHITRHDHPSCVGHVRDSNPAYDQPGKRPRTKGTPCLNAPTRGGKVCAMHGGKSPRAKAAAVKNLAETKARAAVELFAARRDIEPGAALLELVQWTAGEVDYWRQEVRLIEKEDLTWGVTRVKEGGDDRGTTQEAKPNIAYALLVDSSNRLAAYSVACLKAGVAERAVRVSEQQGIVVAQVLRSVLTAMFEVVVNVLRERGVSDTAIVSALTEAWAAAMAVVVPREFRRLSDGEA